MHDGDADEGAIKRMKKNQLNLMLIWRDTFCAVGCCTTSGLESDTKVPWLGIKDNRLIVKTCCSMILSNLQESQTTTEIRELLSHNSVDRSSLS